MMSHVPQSDVNYVTNLTISQITNLHFKLTSNISMSRGLISTWKKETDLEKHLFFFFADEKISEVVYKICSFVNYVTLCVLFVEEEVQLLQLKAMKEL